MPDSTTTNYGWAYPTVGGDSNTWGGTLNTTIQAIDTALGLAVGRNRLVNGDPIIDQRNGGASQTYTAGAAVAYNVDRWYGSCTGANVTGQQVNGPTGYLNAYQYTGAASVTGIIHGQRIESNNCADLVSQIVSVSAVISNSLLTTVTWTAYYANSKDTFSSKTQIATGTWTVTSTNTKYLANFNAGANAGNGIAIEFSVGAQTSGTWKITGAQLEPGSVGSPFERIPYSESLLQCQRYAQVWRVSADGPICPATVYSNTGAFGILPIYPPLRANPTGSVTGSNGGVRLLADNSAATVSATGIGNGSQTAMEIDVTYSLVASQGQSAWLRGSLAGDTVITATAEL